ncbi:hypothetical protein B0H16DRAFT_1773058 [Mycena metata]|uniref:DUF6534 domain-containing protein n=1 Tax=Mycena metata TaxID=1033252 RepID=A0AAD7HYR4_9AGAR|nr:hypothetical protein B0H16DRAFT_1773058 [Mycena metata]
MTTPDIPTTLGSMLIGSFFASMLSGVVWIQTILYHRAYKSDPIGFKLLVFTVWGLDTLHTAFIWGGMWDYFISYFGDTDNIDHIPWSIALTVALTAIVTFLVHWCVPQLHFLRSQFDSSDGGSFFAHRIFLLSKRNLLMTAPVVILALLRLGAACVSTWEMFHYHSFDLFKLHARWIFTLGLSVSSAVDILITGSLFYLFQSNRQQFGTLNHIIDKLTLYAFETGGLTCLGTVIAMICWVTMSQNLVFLGLHFVIGKLYANSLLVTLNTRENIRRARSTSSGERGPVVFLETRGHKNSAPYYNVGPSTPSTPARESLLIGDDRQSGSGPSSPDKGHLQSQLQTELQINVETSVHYDTDKVTLDGRN